MSEYGSAEHLIETLREEIEKLQRENMELKKEIEKVTVVANGAIKLYKQENDELKEQILSYIRQNGESG
jgi:predicted RNase H-like nuclease (RuvC/YqgF family)